jgi:hypothetical protein
MTLRTGNISNLLAPGLRKVFFDYTKGLGEAEYSKVSNQLTTDRNYFDDFEMSMLGGDFPVKDEGVSITYVDPVTGNTKRYTPVTYAKGFRITEEAYDDDLYKTIGPKASKALAKAARNAKEVRFGAFLDDSCTGTTYTGFDSQALCYSTGHSIIYTLGTYANEPSTAVDLSVTALQVGISNIELQQDSDGVVAGYRAKYLITHANNRFLVAELLKSDYKPYTANNEINALAGEGLVPIFNHYMTDTDLWLLLAAEHDINFVTRKKLRFDNSDDFDTGDAKFKATERYTLGFGNWRGSYGTVGG